VRDLRHQAAYLFGAVCPARDAGVALVLPTVGTAAMQAMLDELAQAVSPGAHAVVPMDRAGWHVAKDLTVPANLTPVFLPPYSPELNAIERIWLYLASASSRTGSGRATTTSSMPAARPGTRSSTKPVASVPSAPSTGPNRSVLNGVGIIAWILPKLKCQLCRKRTAKLELIAGVPQPKNEKTRAEQFTPRYIQEPWGTREAYKRNRGSWKRNSR
jgi:hypothetical protein